MKPSRLFVAMTILVLLVLFVACATPATPIPVPMDAPSPTYNATEVLETPVSTLDVTENPLSGGFATPVGSAAAGGSAGAGGVATP